MTNSPEKPKRGKRGTVQIDKSNDLSKKLEKFDNRHKEPTDLAVRNSDDLVITVSPDLDITDTPDSDTTNFQRTRKKIIVTPSKKPAKKRQRRFDAEDVKSAKYEQQTDKIKRQGTISGWNDYLGFIIAKIFGIALLTIGGLEWLAPDILSIELVNSQIIAAVGLALLTGKNIISLIAKLEKSGGKS